jgi:hypothetical protein
MINHISIAVRNPEKVAGVLAELWGGFVVPFPPAPNSFMVLANDGRGSAVEVTPIDTVLIPGEGFPPEENFDITMCRPKNTKRNSSKAISRRNTSPRI